ncbi:MAG: enoyl-CoA hydratase/isomerase family protein [Pseudomonadota bacterium]
MSDDILTRIEGQAGIISLNKPATIHALTLDMVHSMTAQLQAWASDSAVACIIIDHSEGRGFCAGGDIRFLQESALVGGEAGRKFFHDEYQLNHLLFTYPKPVIAFMDGITMGGGVGISQPAKYRIATENTRFAMPETGIGLFPDVGGSWYLSRLPGRVGQYLALTGARIDGADCLAVGLATHYLPSASLASVKAAIRAAPETIEAILNEAQVGAPLAKIVEIRPQIECLFASDIYEDILATLENEGGEWAIKELKGLRTKSPQTCKVALRQLAHGLNFANFADNMAMEYRIASHVLTRHDFIEGVRAVIVDKDNAPQWNPATPEGVTDVLLDEIFAPLPANEEWKPL